MDDIINRLAKELYEGRKGASYDPELLSRTAAQLSEAVFSGYGKNIADLAYNTPDQEMLANLTRNVYSFSSAKNYQQLRDITSAIMDGDKVRSFPDFMQTVEGINSKFNKTWLQTEYDTAIGSAQMASRWTDFQKDKKNFPNLTYRTVGDENVRQSHRSLDGVCRPVDDSFWKSYYPPNGWNCRCDVEQSGSNEKNTPEKNIITPEVPAMFRTNLAQNGVVFPSGHPYYEGTPKAVLSKSFNYLPAEAQFKSKLIDNCWINESLLTNGRDRQINKQIAEEHLAKKEGVSKVFLLAEFDKSQPKLRQRLMLDFYKKFKIKLPDEIENGAKCVDSLIIYNKTALLLDFKGTSGSVTSIGNHLKNANIKANAVLLHATDKNVTTADIVNVIAAYNHNIDNLEYFFIKAKDELIVKAKNDFAKKTKGKS